jgi:hypothetical protein
MTERGAEVGREALQTTKLDRILPVATKSKSFFLIAVREVESARKTIAQTIQAPVGPNMSRIAR